MSRARPYQELRDRHFTPEEQAKHEAEPTRVALESAV